MKNVFTPIVLCAAFVLSMSVKGVAVWAPSTALTEETAPSSREGAVDRLDAIAQRAHEVVAHLEADERQLHSVLQNIEDGKKKLQEHADGYFLH